MADPATVIIVPRVPPGGEVASTITLSASSYTADENTVASFTVKRVNGFGNTVTVDWAITGVAAATITSDTVTFAPGVGEKVVNVPLDELAPPDQVGTLTLSNAVNVTGELSPILGSPFTASFTAVDVPVQTDVLLSLSSTTYSGAEQTNITFYINRTGAVGTTAVSVDYDIVGVTASPLSDTVVFSETDTQIPVDIAAGDVTANEFGTLTLSNPQNLSADGNPVALQAPLSASFNVTVQTNTGLLLTLPDWNAETAAYAANGLIVTNAVEELGTSVYTAEDLDNFKAVGIDDSQLNPTNQATNRDGLHDISESDFLWTAYHMHKRLDGIKPTAASIFLERRNNLANWFINNYYNRESYLFDRDSHNLDHLYGWGLCDYYEETDLGLTTLQNLRADVSAHMIANSYVSPNRGPTRDASGGRRCARNLHFAARLAEVDPTAANRTWRDSMVDLVLDDPGWDATYNAYFINNWPVTPGDVSNTGLDWNAGDRVMVTYHMGMMLHALFVAWRSLKDTDATRAVACAQRLVDLAGFYLNAPTDATTGLTYWLMGRNTGTGLQVNNPGPSDVYTIPPINGLVIAYKFTGNQAYLTRAWDLFKAHQASDRWEGTGVGTTPVSYGTVHHYVDTLLGPAPRTMLAHNKGELQYTFALFENDGAPIAVDAGIMPSWYPSSANTILEMTDFGTAYAAGIKVNPSHYAGSIRNPISDVLWNHRFYGWNGGALVYKDGLPYIVNMGGGHNGYGMNDLIKFGPLYGSDTPSYSVEPTYTPATTVVYPSLPNTYWADGLPLTPHTYYGLEGVGSSMWLFRPSVGYGQEAPYPGGPQGVGPTDLYDMDNESWVAEDTYDDHPANGSSGTSGYAYHKTRNRFYQFTKSLVYEFDPTTPPGTWTNKNYNANGTGEIGQEIACAIDHTRSVAVAFDNSDASDAVRIDLDTYIATAVSGGPTFSGSRPHCIVYAECIDKFVVPQVNGLGVDVYFLDADTYEWSSTTFTLINSAGGNGTNPKYSHYDSDDTLRGGPYNRFRYVPELNGCIFWGGGDKNMYFYRLV